MSLTLAILMHRGFRFMTLVFVLVAHKGFYNMVMIHEY
jgi:hypothetical protein